MPKYRIGCSGFLYDSWRGTFYPDFLSQKRWLSFYVEKFDTVELNVTFYRLLKKEAFERWYKETPPKFTFSLKGSRFITHIKKLKDVELPLITFFNTTAPLLEKLEVVLWQLPPNFKLNLKNLEDFIEAIKLYPVRHVFEFRHKSWVSKKVIKLLSEANIAICMADWPDFINDLPLTADFVYIRRHGEFGSYTTDYSVEQLKHDAKRIKNYLKLGKDVYVYFNNDAMGFAPKNAQELRAILETSLPKSLKETEVAEKKRPKKKKPKPKKKLKPKKKKPVKKVSRKVTKKPKKKVQKKKKPVKQKAKKVKTKKTKKVLRKPVKKIRKKKTAKRPVKKKKPLKKTVRKKPVKRIVKKKVSKKPVKVRKRPAVKKGVRQVRTRKKKRR
jgi:uncharacterized protein YecE (DUF72 family)